MASDKKAEQSYQDWEKPLFDAWKEKGYFGRTPGFGKNGANTYTIVIPPPNVTGMPKRSCISRDRICVCLKRHHSRHLHPSCSHAGLSGPLDPRH